MIPNIYIYIYTIMIQLIILLSAPSIIIVQFIGFGSQLSRPPSRLLSPPHPQQQHSPTTFVLSAATSFTFSLTHRHISATGLRSQSYHETSSALDWCRFWGKESGTARECVGGQARSRLSPRSEDVRHMDIAAGLCAQRGLRYGGQQAW